MAAKVPTTESGRARLGMIVADTLRRKAKMTSTTSTSAASMVSFTSRTEARMDCERSNRISTCTEGGSHALKVGRSAVTASATSTVLVPLGGAVPRGRLVVLDAVDHLPQLLQADGRAVAVGDDHGPVLLGAGELASGLDGEGPVAAVERAG